MVRAWQMLLVLLVGFVKAEFGLLKNSFRSNSPTTNNETDQFSYCIRKCDGIPRTCYYKLSIEPYSVLGGACKNCAFGTPSDCLRPQCITANGYYRGLITVNRQLPAPAIQVCRGDRIIADVENLLQTAMITIHWHGIKQNGFQYYDGVPFVTQCPINPGRIFRYDFVVKEAGTFYYYSHIGVQKMDGISGPLIVRDVEDGQSRYYDEDRPDHVMFISDWLNIPAGEYIPGFFSPDMMQVADTYLINGRGMHWDNNRSINLPLAEFTVSYCVRYRFRLIGGICGTCAVAIMFQGHKVLVISADGNLQFSPKHVTTVILNSGDRFDVVLEASKEVGTYFIFAENIHQNFCGKLRQIAILRYEGSAAITSLTPPPSPRNFGTEFNAVNSKCDGKNKNHICISHLQGRTDAPSIGNECFASLFTATDFYYIGDSDLFAPGTYQPYDEWKYDTRFSSLLNNISFKFPPINLLTQFNEIPMDIICNTACKLRVKQKPCHCTNIYHLPYKTLINLIIYDDNVYTYMRHSFHLHGFNFYVIEQGAFPSTEREDKQKMLEQLMYNLNNDKVDLCSRPQRDTITIPSRGYVLIRFYTDNPGFWLLHCQYAFHMHSGMATVFRVGDQSDLPPVPKNFPRCGNFIRSTFVPTVF